MVVFFNQDFLFFILFFFLPFHFHPHFILFFFFLFLVFLLHTRQTAPLLFIFFFTSRTFQRFTSERERERGEIGLGLHRMHLHRRSSISTAARCPPHQSAWVRSTCSFSFFFSYLLVLIQLYFKNWISFCVFCLDYVRNGVRSACSFFSFSFFSYLLVLIQLYFKNQILFFVLCLDYYVRNGENKRKKEIRRREKELI